MCPSDKELLRDIIRREFDRGFRVQEKSLIRIAEWAKNEVGNDFINELKSDIEN